MGSNINIFISYSHKDGDYKNALETHLAHVKSNPNVTLWQDHLIKPGNEWDEEIKNALGNANIILLLISADFLSSQYINSIELKTAIEKHKNGEAAVIPIFIRPCFISETSSLFKIQGLPAGKKFVSQQEDKDSAYFEIATGIFEVIQKMSDDPAPSPINPTPDFNQREISVSQLENKKQIYLAISSVQMKHKRRSLFLALHGRTEWENWPYTVVPNPSQLDEILAMSEKDQEIAINELLDESMFSIHLIGNTSLEPLPLDQLQYNLAKKKCTSGHFNCLVALERGNSQNKLVEETKIDSVNNPKIKMISDCEQHTIIEVLDGLIEENDEKKERLKNTLKEDKSVFLLFNSHDSDSPLRTDIKVKLEKDYKITVRQSTPSDYQEEGFNVREFEKDQLKQSDGVILLYGDAPEGWYISRQAQVFEEAKNKSKESRAVCVDGPDRETKIERDIMSNQFIVFKDPDELDEFAENL